MRLSHAHASHALTLSHAQKLNRDIADCVAT